MDSYAYAAEKIETKITTIPFIDLKRQYFLHQESILNIIDSILSSGNYILGEIVESFEERMEKYLNCKHVLAVANGTDALILALKSLKIGYGDEVILPVNSFVATAGAVIAVGAIPVLCDVREDYNIDTSKIESIITKRTKAIIPVHLTGRPAEMDKLMSLAQSYSFVVIEDAAQSIGAKYKDRMTGTIGNIGCFSLHPLKNLHIYGDGGLISTNDDALYNEIKLLRNHGLINRDRCLIWGLNSRLDTIQAGIANFGLNYLDQWNAKRRSTANRYCQSLQNVVRVPVDQQYEYAVYHNFIISTKYRDDLMNFLLKKGIETKIHYPIQIHLQPAARSLGYKEGDFPVAEKLAREMISLPIYSELKDFEINYIIDTILFFYSDRR